MSETITAEHIKQLGIFRDPARPLWPGVLIRVGNVCAEVTAGEPWNFADSFAAAVRIAEALRPQSAPHASSGSPVLTQQDVTDARAAYHDAAVLARRAQDHGDEARRTELRERAKRLSLLADRIAAALPNVSTPTPEER